ncbi:MAG: 6,7-dimethyl-8-ribityllumazine synthase [Ignavibacteria bacterium]|nr:6,7-dimethyl-8-ribityllumazine synthase [Ignavibacteriota bacterium]
MANKFHGELNNEDLKIAIIISRFNEPITGNLLEGALTALKNNNVEEEDIDIFYVPGAFEIPAVFKKICRINSGKKKYDGVITIGCVIKGETAHFEYICESVSINLNTISFEYEMPHGFCVLTCYTPQQAYERSLMPPDEDNNKGYEAALTVLEMVSLMKKL